MMVRRAAKIDYKISVKRVSTKLSSSADPQRHLTRNPALMCVLRHTQIAMAAYTSEDEISESEFSENVEGLSIQPYMFEPEYVGEDIPSEEEEDSASERQESDEEDENRGRVGRID